MELLNLDNREWEEKVNPQKPYLVFICNCDDFEAETGLNIDGYLETDSWTGDEPKARLFMDCARNLGRCYTLKEFQEAVNQQYEENLTNSFLFITNKY